MVVMILPVYDLSAELDDIFGSPGHGTDYFVPGLICL